MYTVLRLLHVLLLDNDLELAEKTCISTKSQLVG